MVTKSSFKQIVGYMDRLHRDVGQLVVLAERLMEEEGFIALPRYRNQSNWQLTSHYERSGGWRARYIVRFYVPIGQKTFRSTIFHLINLEENTAFDFPTLLCGFYMHDELTEVGISQTVFTDHICSLARKKSAWSPHREEGGWLVTEPAFKNSAAVRCVKGYILNALDIVGRKHVIDNIVRPLTHPEQDLDQMLTVAKYPFAALHPVPDTALDSD